MANDAALQNAAAVAFARTRSPAVVVHADAGVLYGRVIAVMDVLRTGGLSEVSLSAAPESP